MYVCIHILNMKSKRKKILLAGNYTCSNRGDLAILYGLYHALQDKVQDWDITISTAFPVTAKELLDFPFIKDEVIAQFETNEGGFMDQLNYNYLDKWRLDRLRKSIAAGKPKITSRFAKAVAYIEQFDVVIQVGGSYYIDVYGPYKFLTMGLALALEKPVYMAGHSIGPFDGNEQVRQLASDFFPLVQQIHIRDNSSLEYLDSIGMKKEEVYLSADTAWLLPDTESTPRIAKELSTINKPMIAITARNLGLFAKRLGVTQENYEAEIAKLLDIYIAKGYQIIGVSMATSMGMATYLNDRNIAASICQQLADPSGMTVLQEEYNHLEIGYILSQCELLIGTRLHSVILSMRYGTPAIALYYEHKSKGTLDKMQLSDFSFMINEIGSDRMKKVITSVLDGKEEVRQKVLQSMENERNLAMQMVENIIKEING
jgi:colanic acid/amylovoran biosynthesis protein